MTTRDFITYIANSPDIDTELAVLEPQEVLLLIDGKEYQLNAVWVRGDNKLILESRNPNKQER